MYPSRPYHPLGGAAHALPAAAADLSLSSTSRESRGNARRAAPFRSRSILFAQRRGCNNHIIYLQPGKKTYARAGCDASRLGRIIDGQAAGRPDGHPSDLNVGDRWPLLARVKDGDLAKCDRMESLRVTLYRLRRHFRSVFVVIHDVFRWVGVRQRYVYCTVSQL